RRRGAARRRRPVAATLPPAQAPAVAMSHGTTAATQRMTLAPCRLTGTAAGDALVAVPVRQTRRRGRRGGPVCAPDPLRVQVAATAAAARNAGRPRRRQQRACRAPGGSAILSRMNTTATHAKRRHFTDDERATILAALAANDGNVPRTAREHNISARTLYAWKNGERHPEAA